MNTPDDLHSPYQPPATELSAAEPELPGLAPHERSAAPKVFGVLSIIFASLELLFSALGMLAGAATGAADAMSGAAAEGEKAELQAMMHPMAKIYQGFALQSVMLFVMSAVLLAIGIGQLRYRAWARRWSVYWGGAALACVAAMIAISVLIISPAYAELFDSATRLKPGTEAMPGAMGSLSSIIGGAFAIICVILYTPYPAMMLLFFTRERVRASMTE